MVDFHQDKDIAKPVAVYGSFSATAKYWSRLKWDYWVNFGLGFGGNPYNKDTYPNPTLGTKTNMYIGLGTGLKYNLGNYFDLGLGLAFNHLSNGATQTPNKGLNFVAPQLSLTYHPYEYSNNEKLSSRNLDFEKFDQIEWSDFLVEKMFFIVV